MPYLKRESHRDQLSLLGSNQHWFQFLCIGHFKFYPIYIGQIYEQTYIYCKQMVYEELLIHFYSDIIGIINEYIFGKHVSAQFILS